MTRAVSWNLMRPRAGSERVTNVELFFDLVYVFAVTQLSQYLLNHRSPGGWLRTGLLLTMVWLVWAYTTWVTNWLDPERIPVRLLLLALVPASLVMSAALPYAFGAGGLAVGGAYAAMQMAAARSPWWRCAASDCGATTCASSPGV
jgi:low temperature requirement protein LtrA